MSLPRLGIGAAVCVHKAPGVWPWWLTAQPSRWRGVMARFRRPEGCVGPESCVAPARVAVAGMSTPKTDQRTGARVERTRSLVASVADSGELRRRRRWRRLRRSARSPSPGRPHPEIGPALLARWCQAPPAPQSCCTASLFTSLRCRHDTDRSRMCGSEFCRTGAGAELDDVPTRHRRSAPVRRSPAPSWSTCR
jgi:hypothetical protein